MSASAKSVIIAAIGLLFALILGSEIGQSARMVPIVTAIVCVGTFIYVAFFRTVRFEALILGILLFGYIVGNRGFAQLTFRQNSFLYAGEVGMLVCLFLLGVRRAMTRELIIPKTPLAWAILAFLAMGGVRLYFDTVLLNTSSLVTTAIRDSAVAYYALFFFIAYQIGKNVSARKFVEHAMLAGFFLLIAVAVIEIWSSDLLNRLTFRGYPLIQYKGDLLATFLGIGAFYFFLTPTKGIIKIFYRICSLVSLCLMLFPMSRAGLSGFVCAALLLAAAKRPKFLIYQIGIALAALCTITFLQLSNIHFESDFFRNLSDRASSIVDFSGTGHYHGKIGDASVANNEFRSVWWTTVFDETMQKGPFFGLGFGYDLTSSFMRTYFLTGGEDTATTRSPHSIIFTILGRMGLIGLASFLVILFLIARMALSERRAVARREHSEQNLIPWCASIMLLIAAMFGVVLEGPMGGVLFWSLLGLAASQSTEDMRKSQPRLEPAVLERSPLAAPVPVGQRRLV